MSILEMLLLVLAIFGGIDIALKGARHLGWLVPRWGAILQIPIKYLSRYLRIRALQKTAEAARLEGMINDVVLTLRPFLPANWLSRARIEWQSRNSIGRLGDGTVVLRILPRERANENALNAIWYFLGTSIFPGVSHIVGGKITDAVCLVLVRKALEIRYPHLLGDFDSLFVASQVVTESDALLKFAEFRKLDRFGLLLGPYIREIDANARSKGDAILTSEMAEIGNQIEEFLKKFEPIFRKKLNDADWIYQGGGESFAILLVSKPEGARPLVDAYVRRARQFLNRDVFRIYLLGRQGEFAFLTSVVEKLTAEPELHGLEEFCLTRGYNGSGSGRGVVLGIDQVIESLRLDKVPKRAAASLVTSRTRVRAGLGEAEGVILQALTELESEESDWVHSGALGAKISKISPNFSVSDYGYERMRPLLEDLKSLEIEMRPMPNGPPVMYVRRLR